MSTSNGKASSASEPICVEDIQGDRRWLSLHERFIAEAAEKEPEVLFLGDSLFQQLEQTDVWSKMFEPLHSLNFSIGGDQTQNLLWRISNGELDKMELKIVVVLIGTNNFSHTAEEIAEGVEEIAHVISQKQPQAQIIIMGIPPRGKQPNPLRDKLGQVNKILDDAIPKIPNCSFLNLDSNMFVHPTTGLINHHDMYDYLHCTKQGYQKLCEPLWEEMQQLMQTYVKVESTSVDTASIAGELASDRTI